ncbi:hypothetical protein FA09DRAFT_101931 [Tilletiopsis washingtonensis]|uniref:Uncharacterized protein n=1 Tax=Tilletiopsis washingtonensis TaxID=58919 RepID=A0A316Z2G5_9BASI|nr:hypothetical protein FA09DRAFT_101931 [Tilletiopsis washingtonensis]PWN95980.1 hypothetical protein FA09DRAFT_101931 [Tilletiopsis washingtonensis]
MQLRIEDVERCMSSEKEKATQALYDRAEIQDQLKALRRELDGERGNTTSARTELTTTKDTLIQAERFIARLEERAKALDGQVEALECLTTEKERSITEALARAKRLEEDITTLRKKEDKQADVLETLRKKEEAIRESLSAAQGALRESQGAVERARLEKATLEEQVAQLTAAKESLEKAVVALEADKTGLAENLRLTQLGLSSTDTIAKERLAKINVRARRRLSNCLAHSIFTGV